MCTKILYLLHFSADLGDYNPEEQIGNYIADYKLLLKQTPKVEDKIMETHQSLKGTNASAAELQFLKKAAALDTYGVDPHPVKVEYTIKVKTF